MIFESKLSCEQIKHRLIAKTEPLGFQLFLTDEFLAKWDRDDTFYLLIMSEWQSIFPSHSFVGKVKPNATGCTINGKFTMLLRAKIFTACFSALPWVIMFFKLINGDIFDAFIVTMVAMILLTWSVSICVFFRYGIAYFQKKDHEKVINFINENLLD